jgi:hypothetical protein
MITDYDSFILYFKTLALSHNKIKSFYDGSIDRLSEAVRSNIEYYAFYLAYPEIQQSEDFSHQTETYSSAITLFGQFERDDHEAEQFVLNETLQTIRQLVGKIREDVFDDLIELKIKSAYEVVAPTFSDHCTGWRFEFDIIVSLCNEYNENDPQWQ